MKRKKYFDLLNLVGVVPPVTRLAHTILLVLGVRLGIQRAKLVHVARSREARRSLKAEDVRTICARLTRPLGGSRGTSRTRRGPLIFYWGGHPRYLPSQNRIALHMYYMDARQYCGRGQN